MYNNKYKNQFLYILKKISKNKQINAATSPNPSKINIPAMFSSFNVELSTLKVLIMKMFCKLL